MSGFELENILNYRKYIENQIKNELGRVAAMLRLEEAQYMDKRDHKDQAEKAFQNRINHGASASQFRIHLEYMEKLNNHILQQQDRIHEIKLKKHQIREDLIIAAKEKKIMEKLKEKRMQDFLYMEKKNETAILDDFSSGAYIRTGEKI